MDKSNSYDVKIKQDIEYRKKLLKGEEKESDSKEDVKEKNDRGPVPKEGKGQKEGDKLDH